MAEQSSAMRFRGPVLPDGEVRDLYVVDGQVTYEPQPGAETLAEGWIVPGLVDAHCHLGLDENGAVDEATTEQQAITDRDAGALLLRDCGSAADTAWVHEREDLPRLLRAGRHLARTKRYIRNYAHEVEPDELPAYAAQEAQRGDGWVKLVGDWIDRDTGDLEPSFPAEAFAAAIDAAHDHGAKVTAHCFGEEVLPGLIAAGIDCIEHGTGLSTDLIDEMVARGTALVPTVMQLNGFPEYAEQAEAKFPAYSRHMRDLHARRRETIMAAHEAGVRSTPAPTPAVCCRTARWPARCVSSRPTASRAEAALGAASWHAREWLGLDGRLAEGTTADFVVYPRNPLEDLSVLAEPARIVLRGAVVA